MHGCKRIPFEARKCGICSEESDWEEKSPGGMDFCAAIQQLKRKPNQQTRGDIDEEGAEGKVRAHSGRYSRAHPKAGDRAQRTT